MKTLIAFAGNKGCSETIAMKMKEDLGKNITLVDLAKEDCPPLKEFHRIIIGGMVKAGQVQKRIKVFCQKNLDELLIKETGLFICSMETDDKARMQLMNAYPEDLINTAKSTAVFTGGYDFNRMNFIEKLIVKKVRKGNPVSAGLDFEAVRKFSRRMDRVFNPFLFLA